MNGDGLEHLDYFPYIGNNHPNFHTNWLVVWNIRIIFPYIGNFIIPTDELIFFKMVKTTNQPMIHGDLMGLVLVMNGDEW